MNRQIRIGDSKYGTFDAEFLLPVPISPQSPNFAIRVLLFRLKHTVPVVTHAHVLQCFYITWVQSVACQKQRLGQN